MKTRRNRPAYFCAVCGEGRAVVEEYDRLGVWGQRSDLGELSKACLLGFFSASLCLWRWGCSFPPGVGRAPLTGRFYDLFQGRSERGGGQSELTAAAVFSDSFSCTYSICKVSYAGRTCPEPHPLLTSSGQSKRWGGTLRVQRGDCREQLCL